eukprot:Hpha_TRINITY_DN5864_c0_g1::TRINITY_DN5864_c0_g1_i1::g.45541::m.45541
MAPGSAALNPHRMLFSSSPTPQPVSAPAAAPQITRHPLVRGLELVRRLDGRQGWVRELVVAVCAMSLIQTDSAALRVRLSLRDVVQAMTRAAAVWLFWVLVRRLLDRALACPNNVAGRPRVPSAASVSGGSTPLPVKPSLNNRSFDSADSASSSLRCHRRNRIQWRTRLEDEVM